MTLEYKKFEKGIATADFGEDSLWGRPPKRFYRNLDGRHFAELAAVTGLESDANQRGLVVARRERRRRAGPLRGRVPPAAGALDQPQPLARADARRRARGRPAAATARYRSTRDALGAVVTVEAGGLLADPGRLGRLLVPVLRLEEPLLRPRRRGLGPTASRSAGPPARRRNCRTSRREVSGCRSYNPPTDRIGFPVLKEMRKYRALATAAGLLPLSRESSREPCGSVRRPQASPASTSASPETRRIRRFRKGYRRIERSS